MQGVPQHRHQDRILSRTPLLQQIATQPLCAYSLQRRLHGNANSPFQVERSNDNARLAIPFTERGYTNLGAVSDHCTSNTGTVYTITDQSASARDMNQTTNSAQPTIWTGSAFKVTGNGGLCMTFDGSNDKLVRSDAYGQSGNPALTVACVVRMVTVSGSPCVWSFGGINNHELFGMLFSGTDSSNVYAWQNNSYREFGVSGAVSGWRRYVFTSASGGSASGNTVSEDGSALSQTGVSNTAKNMANNGARIGCYTGDSLFANMEMSFYAVWNAILSADELAAVDYEMQLHV